MHRWQYLDSSLSLIFDLYMLVKKDSLWASYGVLGWRFPSPLKYIEYLFFVLHKISLGRLWFLLIDVPMNLDTELDKNLST